MTHFLYRSQQSATSEFLKDSRGFRKRCGLRRSRGHHPWTDRHTIDSFDPFNIFQANRLSANPALFHHLTCATTFGMALALERDAMLRINCEAVMWKITTRGFTLEEVLILAAMNLLPSADTAKHEKRASQTSKGDRAWI